MMRIRLIRGGGRRKEESGYDIGVDQSKDATYVWPGDMIFEGLE